MKHTFLLSALSLLLAPVFASAQVTNTPEIAAKIQALGPELSREMVGGTMFNFLL